MEISQNYDFSERFMDIFIAFNANYSHFEFQEEFFELWEGTFDFYLNEIEYFTNQAQKAYFENTNQPLELNINLSNILKEAKIENIENEQLWILLDHYWMFLMHLLITLIAENINNENIEQLMSVLKIESKIRDIDWYEFEFKVSKNPEFDKENISPSTSSQLWRILN